LGHLTAVAVENRGVHRCGPVGGGRAENLVVDRVWRKRKGRAEALPSPVQERTWT
jgi:hypothetical protein